jgi:hypothetical protein
MRADPCVPGHWSGGELSYHISVLVRAGLLRHAARGTYMLGRHATWALKLVHEVEAVLGLQS